MKNSDMLKNKVKNSSYCFELEEFFWFLFWGYMNFIQSLGLTIRNRPAILLVTIRE